MDWGWKRSFKIEREGKAILGLDIGLSSIKIVRLRKESDGYVVTACGISEVPLDGGNGSNYRKRLANVARAIRECRELSDVNAKMAVCGVSGPEVAVRDFEFPSIPDGEVEGAVQLEASQVCPFKTEDSTVDYQVMGNGNDKIRGILVAATNALIKSKMYLSKQAALSCVLMDVDGLGLLNCFGELESQEPGQATAILNVGGSYTTLAIMGADGWPFIRDMIYVGDDIVKQMAAEKDVSPGAVRQALSGESETEGLELYDSLERASKKLVADITETLRYYNTQNRPSHLKKIFVCGGFAPAEGFIEILNRQLPVETVLWNPFEKIRCETGNSHRGVLQKKVLQRSGPAMAVAAGLAMRLI